MRGVGTVKVLIAGGPGYIGGTIASACFDAGISPVVLDNLMTGRHEFVAGRVFYQGDIADGPLIDHIFGEPPDIAAVVHCAALIMVPDSVADPIGYFRANVTKSLDFAARLLRNGCGRLIFSSSAAICRASAGPRKSLRGTGRRIRGVHAAAGRLLTGAGLATAESSWRAR
jgi:UDP-glucose 4-epimerase